MSDSLALVEIELSSYCNRSCNWCPNNFIDRKSKKETLSREIFTAVLNTLNKIGYNKTISFSRYNEPLANDFLPAKLEEAKSLLPEVRLVANTNGDYLSEALLDCLLIDELTIMDYDCQGMAWCRDRLTGLNCRIISENYPYLLAERKNMFILYYADWPQNAKIEDRGGSLDAKSALKRLSPCFEPQKFAAIDYTGMVMPCCNLRSDILEHQPYIIGDLRTQDFLEVLNGEKRRNFQDILSNNDYNNYPYPCRRCQKKAGRYTRVNPGIKYN